MEHIYCSGNSYDRLPKISETAPHSDPTYDDYIHSLLSNYGIQFSPGGSGIVEIEEEPCSPYFVEDQQGAERSTEKDEQVEEEEPSRSTVKQVAERNESVLTNLKREGLKSDSGSYESANIKRVSVDGYESDDDAALTIDESGEVGSTKGIKHVPRRRKKAKLYEMEPLEDPEKEKKRMNAVLARKNREMKKRIMMDLDEKVRRLRHVNTQCTKVIRRTDSDIQQLRQDLSAANASVTQLTEVVRSKDREIRQQREKLLLFQGHLDLIGSSLDDDNPARRLIQALLHRLSSSATVDAKRDDN